MDAIEAEWKKLVADVTNTSNMPINKDTGPKEDTPIVKSVSFTKLRMNSKGFFFFKFNSIKGLEDVLESGPWMIRNSPIILKKWMINTRPCKEELTLIPVWVKIHDVPIQVFLEDGISLIASQIGKPIMLDSYTSSMCIESWGRKALGMRIRMETVCVEYEWKPPRCKQCKIFGHMNDQCPKNATTVPNVMNDDGFQTVVNKKKSGKTGFTVVKTTWQHVNQKEKPSKAANVPSSSFSRGSAKNGDLQYLSSASNIHTSNPYNALDDMESDEKVEVVYDEKTNLFGNNITRATYTATDASKT
ncbi:zinc knuckle CX2CX4HX4C containing protein [Tanacetum coccineum]